MFLVLIDTSAYEEQRLSFQGDIFDSLIRLSDENKITIIGCNVLRREIESHVREKIAISVNRIKKVSADFDRLTKDDLGEVTRMLVDTQILKDRIFNERKARIDNFFSTVNYEEIDLSKVNINSVLDDYFSFKPPFGAGKKKHEFPDAFVLNGFLDYYRKRLASTCIVSADGDWRSFIEKHPDVRMFDKITEFIDFIHSSYDKEFTESLKQVLVEHDAKIIEEIKNEISDYKFEVDDTWINAELEMVSDSVIVRVTDYNVISIEPESAQIEATAEIYVELTLWASDETAMVKDSDTKEWIYFGTNQYLVQKKEILDVTISITFDPHPEYLSDSFEIDEVSIPDDFYYLDGDEHDFALVQHWNED